MTTIYIMSDIYAAGYDSIPNIRIDCRILENPYWTDELRFKTGLDEEVQAFIQRQPEAQAMIEALISWIRAGVQKSTHNYEVHYEVHFVCTGGQHRSVSMAEILAREIKRRYRSACYVHVIHRNRANWVTNSETSK